MMKAAMASMLVLLAVVSIAEQLCECEASGGAGGFSVEFIHRDNARSPFHDPALTAHDRMLAAARRSTARAVALAARSSGGGTDDVVSKVVSGTFEYLMAVNIGTPPRAVLAIADTGSDLVWVKCKSSSYDTSKALFDPSRSSTYGRVSCQSDACEALNDASCDEQSNCHYYYSYGDGSDTTGILSTETFTFVDEVVDSANSIGVSRIASPRVYAALVACFKSSLDCFFRSDQSMPWWLTTSSRKRFMMEMWEKIMAVAESWRLELTKSELFLQKTLDAASACQSSRTTKICENFPAIMVSTWNV
ncbi:hypothetical protein ABZP36_027779 [Zizania latifolia]